MMLKEQYILLFKIPNKRLLRHTFNLRFPVLTVIETY